MSKTRAELIDQVLIRLQILAFGQSSSAEDVQKVDGLINPAIAQLQALGIFYVSDAGEAGPPTNGGSIEDEIFLPLADYIASFHLLADARMQALALVAVETLRTIAAPPRTLNRLRIDPALQGRRIGTYQGGFS